jgi:hypothetical protein
MARRPAIGGAVVIVNAPRARQKVEAVMAKASIHRLS